MAVARALQLEMCHCFGLQAKAFAWVTLTWALFFEALSSLPYGGVCHSHHLILVTNTVRLCLQLCSCGTSQLAWAHDNLGCQTCLLAHIRFFKMPQSCYWLSLQGHLVEMNILQGCTTVPILNIIWSPCSTCRILHNHYNSIHLLEILHDVLPGWPSEEVIPPPNQRRSIIIIAVNMVLYKPCNIWPAGEDFR